RLPGRAAGPAALAGVLVPPRAPRVVGRGGDAEAASGRIDRRHLAGELAPRFPEPPGDAHGIAGAQRLGDHRPHLEFAPPRPVVLERPGPVVAEIDAEDLPPAVGAL